MWVTWSANVTHRYMAVAMAKLNKSFSSGPLRPRIDRIASFPYWIDTFQVGLDIETTRKSTSGGNEKKRNNWVSSSKSFL